VADVVTFPSAGCAGTLQQCIDTVDAGDTVEIATDTLINEDLTIQKSLTLKSASGFTGRRDRALRDRDSLPGAMVPSVGVGAGDPFRHVMKAVATRFQ
jgi:hypothetical protein